MSAEAESAQRQPEHTMLGRYEVLGRLGAGGMGSVYLARLAGVAGFQRLFAVKLMHSHVASDPRGVDMLLDEARLAAKIHHPNALGILDVFESEHGYCLVMEYVKGVSLDRILEHQALDPDMRLKLGLRAVIDAATGLHAAHQLRDETGQPLGLVHRDVSPHNMLMGTDGSGRIIDFGVARAAQRVTATQTNVVKGKPQYMAPEQLMAKELDARTDVFALGIVLWEVLVGQRLFEMDEGGEYSIIRRLLYEAYPTPSSVMTGVSSELEAVCMKALAREPGERFQSARHFADALERASNTPELRCSPREASDLMARLFGDQVIDTRRLTDHGGRVLNAGSGSRNWTPAGSGFRERAPRNTPHVGTAKAEEKPRPKLMVWFAVGALAVALAGLAAALTLGAFKGDARDKVAAESAPAPPPLPKQQKVEPSRAQVATPPASDWESAAAPAENAAPVPEAPTVAPALPPAQAELAAEPRKDKSKQGSESGRQKRKDSLELEINPYD